MKTNLLYAMMVLLMISCSSTKVSKTNELSKSEKKAGWVQLFNGKDW